jgi:hypothetical protein
MEFTARLGGRTVTYHKDAKFTIEQRMGHTKFALTAERATISDALTAFGRRNKPGVTTRLMAIYEGTRKRLLQK